MQNSLLELVSVRRQAKTVSKCAQQMVFADSANLCEFAQRNVSEQMIVEIVSREAKSRRDKRWNVGSLPRAGTPKQTRNRVYKATLDFER